MSNLPVWKQQLLAAEPKMSAVSVPEKAKIELGFAVQLFEQSPGLQKCDPQSIINAVSNISRTGLTINPVLKLAYLVPRKNKCTLVISYMGLIKTLRDSGAVRHIEANIVYEDEDFSYDAGSGALFHTAKYADSEAEDRTRKKVGAYSRAVLPGGESVYCFIPMWEIDKIKAMSSGGASSFSPWKTWEGEMIKKTVIRRHFKTLICDLPSKILQAALEVEAENHNFERQQTAARPSLSSAFSDHTPQIEAE